MARPWEYVLYWFLVGKDNDRIEDWTDRLARLEASELIAVGFNDPKRLADERSAIESEAAAHTPIETITANARAMAAELMHARLVEAR